MEGMESAAPSVIVLVMHGLSAIDCSHHLTLRITAGLEECMRLQLRGKSQARSAVDKLEKAIHLLPGFLVP